MKQIRAYTDNWNADSKTFVWTATADDILAKVQLVQTSIKNLVDNNTKWVAAGWRRGPTTAAQYASAGGTGHRAFRRRGVGGSRTV